MSVGKAVTYGATGAAAGSVFGPWGTAIGGGLGLIGGALSPDATAPTPVAAPQPYGGVNPASYGTLPLNYGATSGPAGAQNSLALIQSAEARNAEIAAAQDAIAKQRAAHAANPFGFGVPPDVTPDQEAAQLAAIRQKYDAQSANTSDQAQAQMHQQQLNQLTANGTNVQNRQAPVVGANPADAARLGYGEQVQGQDRAAQGQLVGTLQNAAAGNGPSAAMNTLYAGRDANINQAASFANSARGGSGAQALAARSAVMAGANATQQTANQAAILRANEMNNAYGQLGTALASQRAGDTSYNAQNVGIAQQNASMQGATMAQNDAQTQYWNDLYYKAQQGDRDAAMQLQALQSNNYNATISPGVQAGGYNQQSAAQQQQRSDNQYGSTLNAFATAAQAFKAQGGGGSGASQPQPGDPYINRTNPYG